MKDALLAGLDIGSTTVKLVAVDSGSGETVWKSYERHRARPADVAHHALVALAGRNNGRPIHLCATGSGAAPTADLLGVDHIQEVWAVSLAVQARNPEARTVVELGGEDAKAIVMGDGLPTGRGLRTVSMNDRCAGGTGVVIDHVAGRLGMDPRSLSCEDYAAGHIHPVSAKCGVFAESDVVSLHRQGVPDTDLMASLFSAIVRQNLAVLARGHALHPPVVLLGGPHRHLPGLAEAWRRALPALWTDRGVQVPDTSRTALVAVPEDAEFYAAFGAVEHLRGRTEPGEENAGLDLDRYSAISRHSGTESRRGIPGLGSDPDDLAAFRHAYPPVVPALSVVEDGDPVIIGIDAGSTSVKAVALDVHGDVVAKAYRLNQADPIDDAQAVLADLRSRLETSISRPRVAGLAVTGYAKDLFAQVFGADRVLVETAAHAAGGLRVQPDADVICDLGGQDIKVMLVDDGAVHDFRLNSQCCAGTGHFLQASAESLGIVPEDYADHAFRAAAMPEFQHGCAVFLQSERVAFQRDGWGPAEILAGLAAVLPKNVWLHVCKAPDLPRLGRTFVLQGGTQRNLAAVKAQVDYIQRQFKRTGIFPQIIVHPHCGEAGAVGCALELLDGMDAPWRASSFIGFDAAATLRHQSRRDDSVRCTGCGNACVRTFIELITPDGPVRRIMAGACESGEDGRGLLSAVSSAETPASNLSRRAARDAFKPVALPQVVSRPARRFASKRVAATREGLRIGMPQILDFYGLAPFFSGFFQHLGVPGENLIWSGFTAPRLIEDGLGLGRIDPCFPSKVAAAHVHALLKRHRSGRDPLTHLFMPMIDSMPTWLTGVMASKACPAAVGTPEAVYGALMHSGEAVGDGGPVFKRTFLNLDEPDLCARQLHADWSADLRMSRRESREAVAAGLAALRAFEESQRAAAGKLIGRLERESRVGLVLLARPCMNDPGMNHGIPRALSRLGYPVLTCDSLPTDRAFLASLFDAYETLLRVDDVWKHCYSEHNSRMLWAAKVVARHPNLIGVQLSHFKCGNDAVIEAVLRETVAASGKPFFAFADLDEHPAEGAIRMRIETLAHAVEKYRHRVFGVRACEREPGAARALTTVE